MSGKDPLPREQAYEGVRAVNPPDIISSVRSPNSTDRNYPIGTMWLNTKTQVSYQLVAAPGIWAILGGATGGDVQTLSGDIGVATPALGDILISGDNTQGIITTASGSTVTIVGLNATTLVKGVVELASDAEAVAGTEATKAITSAALTARFQSPGPIGGTLASTAIFSSAPATDAITVSSGDVEITLGDLGIPSGGIVVKTGLLSTGGTSGGDIQTDNGNLIIGGSGHQLQIKGGTDLDSIGSGTLAPAGLTSEFTVLDTNISASDFIFLSRINPGTGVNDTLTYTITPGVSFTISSESGSDDSTVAYLIIRQV